VLVVLLIVGIIAVCVYGSNKKKQRAEDIQRHEDDMFAKAHGYDALLAKRREEAKAAQELSAKRGAAVLIGIVVLAVAFAVAGVITGKEPPAPLAPPPAPTPDVAPWTTDSTAQLRCEGSSGGDKRTLDLDVMPGEKLAVLRPLEVGYWTGGTPTLPAGTYAAREDGRGYIHADITTYPPNTAGGGTHSVSFDLTLQKKDGWISIEARGGTPTIERFSTFCKPRPKPAVQAPPPPAPAPPAPAPLAPNSTDRTLFDPKPTYTAPPPPAPPAAAYTPVKDWDSYVPSTGRYIHRKLLVGSDGTYKLVATDHDAAGNSNGGSLCTFNATGWSDCLTNAGEHYQLKPQSIQRFINVAAGGNPN
jgi:hypothetical protein